MDNLENPFVSPKVPQWAVSTSGLLQEVCTGLLCVFESRLAVALGNPIWWVESLPVAEGLELDDL